MSEPEPPYRRLLSTQAPQRDTIDMAGIRIPRYIGEFWTSRQRQASSLHEISYRACFKPQLPRYFIELLTKNGDIVYDPFSGRGTTVVEAALLGRKVLSNDVNPLSEILSRPRLSVPLLSDVEDRLHSIRFTQSSASGPDLSMFYHPRTESEIIALKRYLDRRHRQQVEDDTDRWIRMVATNRLTGHSKGFFSVYTLPPNQAVSRERQVKINARLRQRPEYRDTKAIILEKTRSLLRNVTPDQISNLKKASRSARFLASEASATDNIRTGSVTLTVTSPPFLNVVQYAHDNWLRCWFNSIDAKAIGARLTMTAGLTNWSYEMEDVFAELYRVTKHGGWVAFEVGEVRHGKIRLDETVIPLALLAGFRCEGIIINAQEFTKTSNIWGIHNNKRGTNTNRIALFYKP
ncbi:MAG TPA: DNA methyltransferase [Bacteroidota bacterium]|nr:DNA methyltransferase [Bacteroidota bacterium]